jgi:hypothetical protein
MKLKGDISDLEAVIKMRDQKIAVLEKELADLRFRND